MENYCNCPFKFFWHKGECMNNISHVKNTNKYYEHNVSNTKATFEGPEYYVEFKSHFCGEGS